MPGTLRTFPRGPVRERQRSALAVGPQDLIPVGTCLLLAIAGILLTFPQSYFWNSAHKLSHVIVLGVAALVLSRSENGVFRVRPEFTVLGCMWFIGVCAAAVSHSATSIEVVNYVRYFILVPAGLVVCGRYMSRQPSRWTIVMFALNGAFSLALMYWCVSGTGEPEQDMEGTLVGGLYRLYLNPLDGKGINGPTVVANCAAVFAGGFYLVCRGIIPLKIVQASLLAGGCYLSIVTGTRTPILALLGVLVMVVLAMFRRRMLRRRTILIAAGVLLVLSGGIWGLNQQAEFSRADRFSVETLSDTTLTGRTVIWGDRLTRIAASPFGLGYLGSLDDSGLTAHSIYLEQFISHGWLAGVTFMVLVFILVLRAGALIWNPSGSTHQLACASVMGWCLLVGLAEAYSQSYPQVHAIWWFAVGSFGVFSDSSRSRTDAGRTTKGDKVRPEPKERPARLHPSSRRRFSSR